MTLLAAWRNLEADLLVRTDLDSVQTLMNSAERPYAIGGPDAAVMHLRSDGRNTFADIGTRIVYLPDDAEVRGLPDGSEVLVLRMDRRAAIDWSDGFSSVAQTYADLFALPGWQSAEFRRAMYQKYFEAPDWDQPQG